MVQDGKGVCSLNIVPLAGVDINDAAAKLQSRGNIFDDNIFEILPRFSISPGENDDWNSHGLDELPQVHAAAGGGDVTGITIRNQLVVIERDKEEPVKLLPFSSSIDFIVWRRSILLLGLSTSEIILVDPGFYDIKQTWKLCDTKLGGRPFFVDAFIHSSIDPTKMNVTVVSVDGLVCSFPDVSLSVGTLDATHDQNISLDVDVGTIKEKILRVQTTSEVSCASSPSRSRLLLLEKCGRMVILDPTNDEGSILGTIFLGQNLFSNLILSEKSLVIPKKLIASDGLLFILLSNGIMEVVSGANLSTTAALQLSDEPVFIHDFTLVLNNDGSVKLWTLHTRAGINAEENYVGIFTGPSFVPEFVYKLPVLKHGAGFKFPRHVSQFEEPFSIIEVSSDNVRIYYMLETSTDVTLQKLLARGNYLEAQDLARNYSKDLDIVRKAEARDKLNRITSSHTTGENVAGDCKFGALISVLKEIQDSEFVCSFCVQSQLPKVEWIKEILGLGRKRVYDCPQTTAAQSLLLTLKKFYTFELVYPTGNIVEWNSLIAEDNNMFLQSQKFLQNGNFDKCDTVWKRHSDEFVSEITIVDFLPFFTVLFGHQLKTTDSVTLLKTILPFAVGKVAECVSSVQQMTQSDEGMKELNILISIILRQISSLEGKIEWPANALTFVKVLNLVMMDEIKRYESFKAPLDPAILKKKIIVQKIRIRLDNLDQVLNELTDLKRNHSIRILFKDYTENQIPEVINNLLHNLLRSEEIDRFVSEFLRPYAERKGLNVDYLFVEHIKSVLQEIPYFVQAINIPHEERVISLVNLISSPKIKLYCTQQISEEWPVPWTVGIDNMVKQILETFSRNSLDMECRRFYDSISIMRKQVPYRCVLNKYKLTGLKMLTKRCNVIMALLRILNLKKTGFEDDCKELLKNIPSTTLYNDTILDYLQVTLNMYNLNIQEDEIFSSGVHTNLKLKKLLTRRLYLELLKFESDAELSDLYTPEEQSRFISIYNALAVNSSDSRSSMVARFKRFFPSISLDIVYHPEFPFTILSYLLKDSSAAHPPQLINDCKQISRMSETYYPDILLIAGVLLTQQSLSGNSGLALWSIVEHIVETPLNININNNTINQELLQSGCFEIASVLLRQCPTLSLNQMNVLEKYLCRLCNSFDKICVEVGQMLCVLRIFLSLKEQEIPLEKEFLYVYEWLRGDAGCENVLQKLMTIGETLLKFGENEMYQTVFRFVKRNLTGVSTRTENAVKLYFVKKIEEIDYMQEDLQEKTHLISEEEPERNVRELVDELNEAGIRVNTYALKVRNKVKLLAKLLQMRNYNLAAKLAITFGIYDDHGSWSEMLNGFVLSGNLEDLRRVLENIRTVTQLWMLPEFSSAWKKVSQQDKEFLYMCPIPLD